MVRKKNNTKLISIFLILVLLLLGVLIIINKTSNTVIVLNGSKRELFTSNENTYNIVFDKNNSNASETMPDLNGICFSEKLTLPKNIFAVKKLGVTSKQIFTGWNTKADGTGISYIDEASICGLTDVNNETIILYAQWIDADFQINDPITYTNSLYEAVDVAKDNSTITLIRNAEWVDGKVTISKNLVIDIQDKILHKLETTTINNRAIVTVKGTGEIKQADESNIFTLTNGAKLIKRGTALWESDMGGVIHASNSSFELYGGYVISNSRTIYANKIIDSIIKDTTVYTGVFTNYAIRATGSGNLTISGDSKIGNGILTPEKNNKPVSVIGWASTGTLTLNGNTNVYENGEGSSAIVVGANAKLNCYGNSSIYVNVNPYVPDYCDNPSRANIKGHCILLDSSSTLKLNSNGNFFTQGEIAIYFKTDSNGKSGNFTYTKGKLATRKNKYTVWRYDKYTKHYHPDSLNNGKPVKEKFYFMYSPSTLTPYNKVRSRTIEVYEYSK